MTWFEIAIDIILGVLFVATNVMYAVHHAHSINEIKRYHAFTHIWYISDMNTFGKIVCSIFTGVFCCVGIFVLYAFKLIYWAFHYKK